MSDTLEEKREKKTAADLGHDLFSPELFCEYGRALFGGNWKNPTAHFLGVRENTVKEMAKGKKWIGIGLGEKFLLSVDERIKELEEIKAKIKNEIQRLKDDKPI